jgi:hypothetical protein
VDRRGSRVYSDATTVVADWNISMASRADLMNQPPSENEISIHTISSCTCNPMNRAEYGSVKGFLHMPSAPPLLIDFENGSSGRRTGLSTSLVTLGSPNPSHYASLPSEDIRDN